MVEPFFLVLLNYLFVLVVVFQYCLWSSFRC
ncbi:hypothetical protein [Bacillus clarus]|nr:hypothetical protein [Bacillus clarus]